MYSGDLIAIVKNMLQLRPDDRFSCDQITDLPAFKTREALWCPKKTAQQSVMMKTITFTNRERIEMGEELEVFVDYLAKKLPQADYESSDSGTDLKEAIQAIEMLQIPSI